MATAAQRYNARMEKIWANAKAAQVKTTAVIHRTPNGEFPRRVFNSIVLADQVGSGRGENLASGESSEATVANSASQPRQDQDEKEVCP